MDDSAPSATAQPAKPRVAFLALPDGSHPVRSVEVVPGGYMVAINTAIPGFDHAAGAEVMRLLLGDFEDVTLPGAFDRTGPTVTSVQHDIRTLLGQPEQNPEKTAEQLLSGIVNAVESIAPHASREEWDSADQRSNAAFGLSTFLMEEAIRRHVIGAHQDGRRPAPAARSMLRGLVAACQITAAAYTGGPQ